MPWHAGSGRIRLTLASVRLGLYLGLVSVASAPSCSGRTRTYGADSGGTAGASEDGGTEASGADDSGGQSARGGSRPGLGPISGSHSVPDTAGNSGSEGGSDTSGSAGAGGATPVACEECPPGSSCSDEVCCQDGSTNCGGKCFDLNIDAARCGDCANPCSENETCESGSCKCAAYTFPKACGGGCGSWSFESGSADGWTVDEDPAFPNDGGANSGVTNITVTTNRVHDGTGALAVPALANNQIVSVAVPVCQPGAAVNLAGFTLSAWVYLTGTPLSTESFLFFVAWGTSGSFSSPVLTGDKIVADKTWYRLSATFSSSVQADHVAIRLLPNQSWTGTMYVDSVTITAP